MNAEDHRMATGGGNDKLKKFVGQYNETQHARDAAGDTADGACLL